MPGAALMRNSLRTQSTSVLSSFVIYMAYALVSAGHLPLMMPMLLLAFLADALVARVAWAEGRLEAVHCQNIASPVVRITRLFSVALHMTSAAG